MRVEIKVFVLRLIALVAILGAIVSFVMSVKTYMNNNHGNRYEIVYPTNPDHTDSTAVLVDNQTHEAWIIKEK